MRPLGLAALLMVIATLATPAAAQRLGRMQPTTPPMVMPHPAQPMPMQPRPPHVRPPNPSRPPVAGQPRPNRWGGYVGGRWYGGMRAPGGWNAYRRPNRGWTLPSYWIAPSFYIGDFGRYGLSRPQPGYSWSRYYDDAVLIDQRGRVWDSVGGVDWDGYDHRESGYDAEAYGDGGYAYAQGGQGGYGTSYPAPGYPQQPPVAYAPPAEVVQGGGYTSSYSSSSGYAQGGYAQGGYSSGGYYYPPATTTTVTIGSAPVITTTTTEIIEETTYVAPRRKYRAVKRKPRPVVRKCSCRCHC